MTFPDSLTAFEKTYVPRVEVTIPPVTSPVLFRVLHDAEMGPLWRDHVPEVFTLSPEHAIPLNREWQLFSKQLNLTMTGDKWRNLHGYYTAFTNQGAGYDRPGDLPKQDWVNMRDTTAPELPRFDKPRICGGALVTGRVDGAYLWLDYLDANLPPPAIENVKPWHKFCALNVVNETTLSRFPQGTDGADVWIPLIARRPVLMSLSRLQRWTDPNPPDPYRVYL